MALALRASRPRTRSRAISDPADHAAPYKAANRNAVAKTGGASGGPVLLVVQSCPVTPVGIVGEFAKARGATLRTVHIHQGQRLPRTTAGLDGLIILGGPMHAGDDAAACERDSEVMGGVDLRGDGRLFYVVRDTDQYDLFDAGGRPIDGSLGCHHGG